MKLLMLFLTYCITVGYTKSQNFTDEYGINDASTVGASDQEYGRFETSTELVYFNGSDEEPVGKIPIYLGGFMSIEGSIWPAFGILPAIELALDHINARTDVLAKYELRMVWNDSQCMAGLGTRFLFEQLFREPQKVMLIGPACSGDSQAVSQTAYYWNLITMSYSAASSALSNREEYPYFFRTYVPDAMYNPVRILLMQEFNWTRVATIHTNYEVFSLAIDNLRTLLKEANITILASESFGDSPRNQMENIKATDAHIIIANMYEEQARKVFCEAYRLGMYGKDYMWLMLGWYTPGWWLVGEDLKAENLTCTPEELLETIATSMYIATEVEPIDLSDQKTVAGYTARELQKLYEERLTWPEYEGAIPNGLEYFGYDAAWAIALTLNSSSAIMDAGGLEENSTRNLEDFNYDDKEMAELFFQEVQSLRFRGATGEVSFTDADRVGPTKVEQFLGSCANGWHLGGIWCYRLVRNETLSWSGARSACRRYAEGHLSTSVLAAISSMEDFDFLLAIWEATGDTDAHEWHIGLHQVGSQLLWADITNDVPSWLPKSPIFERPNSENNCFVFDFRDGGSWKPVKCGTVTRPYICRRIADFGERYVTSVTPNGPAEPNFDGLQWPGGVVPIDQTPGNTYLDVDAGIPLALFAVIGGISILGILMTLFFLAFNIYFANQRFVKLSSPKLNNLILIGSILIYVSILMAGLDVQNLPREYPSVCMLRTWMVSVGFVLSFGAMFSKTWRVHRVATFKTPKRRIVTDQQLFGIVGFLLLVDIILLTSWQILDAQRLETVHLIEMPDPEVELQILRPFIRVCTSDHILIWSSALYGYKGLLLIFGTFLAWETRKVTIPALNDSKLIGLSVYNVIILCVIGLGVSFALGDDPGALFLFISCIMLFCTTATLIVIFVPKIVSVYKDPKGENAMASNTVSTKSEIQRTETTEIPAVTVNSIAEENRILREKIIKLQRELTELDGGDTVITTDGSPEQVTVEISSVGCEIGSEAEPSREEEQGEAQSDIEDDHNDQEASEPASPPDKLHSDEIERVV